MIPMLHEYLFFCCFSCRATLKILKFTTLRQDGQITRSVPEPNMKKWDLQPWLAFIWVQWHGPRGSFSRCAFMDIYMYIYIWKNMNACVHIYIYYDIYRHEHLDDVRAPCLIYQACILTRVWRSLYKLLSSWPWRVCSGRSELSMLVRFHELSWAESRESLQKSLYYCPLQKSERKWFPWCMGILFLFFFFAQSFKQHLYRKIANKQRAFHFSGVDRCEILLPILRGNPFFMCLIQRRKRNFAFDDTSAVKCRLF